MIHHIDVGQGDAALIVAPNGDTAMIDNGRQGSCSDTASYLLGAGISHIDYHFATHYHADHIACLDDLLDAGVTVGTCYDRGGSFGTLTYQDYVGACGAARQTASKGQVISLGAVTIEVVDLNGAGLSTSDENAQSLVLKVSYGSFTHVFAGDLPGVSPNVESIVGPEVGDVDVCKVTHHGSNSSMTDAWLNATDPEVCILSVGNNGFGHPTSGTLGRLHAHGVEVYWTQTGSGATPGAGDHVCDGNVIITVGSSGAYDITC